MYLEPSQEAQGSAILMLKSSKVLILQLKIQQQHSMKHFPYHFYYFMSLTDRSMPIPTLECVIFIEPTDLNVNFSGNILREALINMFFYVATLTLVK